MTTLLHLDPVSGIAGDMLLGALLDAGVSLDALIPPLRSLALPPWALSVSRESRGGVAGTRAVVVVRGQDAGNAHFSDPHGHHHLDDLLAIVRRAEGLPESVRLQALAVFAALAEAEAAVHGTSPDHVHLHEVGAADALVDVCGGLLGLHLLGATTISCGPLPLGSGTVHAAHGILPVPAPATARLLLGLPTVPGAGAAPTGELTTPTGAALARVAVGRFGPPPAMTLRRIGHGLGRRERADCPNVLRLLLGEGAVEAPRVAVVTAVLDDLDPRVVPSVVARLLALGALDVFVASGLGKKGRPALRLEALAPDDAIRAVLVDALFRETPTLGARWRWEERTTLPRRHRVVPTPFGPLPVKEGLLDGIVVTRQPELEDCLAASLAHGVPLRVVLHAALVAASADPAEPP